MCWDLTISQNLTFLNAFFFFLFFFIIIYIDFYCFHLHVITKGLIIIRQRRCFIVLSELESPQYFGDSTMGHNKVFSTIYCLAFCVVQGNSRKGFGKCRLGRLCEDGDIDIQCHKQMSRTLFVNFRNIVQCRNSRENQNQIV